MRNVFSVHVSGGEDISGFQEEYIDLQENQMQKKRFESLQYWKFWTQLQDKPILTQEAGFVGLVMIKTKARNRDPQPELRSALPINIKPVLEELPPMRQCHDHLSPVTHQSTPRHYDEPATPAYSLIQSVTQPVNGSENRHKLMKVVEERHPVTSSSISSSHLTHTSTSANRCGEPDGTQGMTLMVLRVEMMLMVLQVGMTLDAEV
ncbi:hypothetical protein Hamer_G016614, partial [Homarus americanus]